MLIRIGIRRRLKGNQGQETRLRSPRPSIITVMGWGTLLPSARKLNQEGTSKALITKKKYWADLLDNDEDVNYALMENTENDYVPSSDPQTSFSYNTDNISELRLFLKKLHTSFKNLTLKNEGIETEMSELVKRNEHVEAELLFMLEIKKERDDAKYVEQEMIK